MHTHFLNLNKQQFLALLLLYAANVDVGKTEEEKAIIINEMGEQAYDTVLNIYNQHNDTEIINVLIELKEKYYPQKEGKAELLHEVKALFSSDHHFSNYEHGVLTALKHLL